MIRRVREGVATASALLAILPGSLIAQDAEAWVTPGTPGLWFGYVMLFLVVGSAVVPRIAARSLGPDSQLLVTVHRRARTVRIVAGALLLLTLLVRLYLQLLNFTAAGENITPELLSAIVPGTAWGKGWLWQCASATALVLTAVAGGRFRRMRPASDLATAGLLVTIPMTGHALEHPWGRVAGQLLHTVHLAGGAVWLGTLAVLFLIILRDLDASATDVSAVVDAFSPVALGGAASAIGAGLLLGWTYNGGLSDISTTNYGRTLLVKLALVAGVLMLGWYNWKRVRPTLLADGSGRIRTTAVIELAIGMALLGATAVLVALAAPALGGEHMGPRRRARSLAIGFAVVAASACRPAQPPANAAPQPIAADTLARRQLVDIQVLDSTIRVDVRYATANNFTGAPLAGYGPQRVYLRQEAAAALARVQRQLAPRGLGLLVFDGYRPMRATLDMVAWAERTGRTQLLDDGYIARRSRHNQAVAVDLTLVRVEGGAALEMGTPYDTFSADAHTANATGEPKANRARLVTAMEAEGFQNYDQEWWHFSFAVDDPVPYDIPVASLQPR